METIILAGLASAIALYLWLGFSFGKQNKTLADIFPVLLGRNARVASTDEFSSSTVAVTLSLATIVMAYFQLSGYFGLFLLWTAITTAIGMLLVSMASRRIWNKMKTYDHRPTLHEYLRIEYSNRNIAYVGAVCTSIGSLLIFATELTVGTAFLAQLVPSIPEIVTTTVLSLVGVGYVMYGGFRTVIKSDQWQMKFIWLLIATLSVFYIIYPLSHGGFALFFNNVPVSIYDFSNRPGLVIFLIGIFIMNVPTHISNMAVWQRIAGTQNIETVAKGFRRGVWGISLSWGLLVILACFAYMFVPAGSKNLLTDLLKFISLSLPGKVVLFIVTIGLYSALLSTSSTTLVAVGQTLSEDIFAKFKDKPLSERDGSKQEFNFARLLLLLSALCAIGVVVGLKKIGFDIKDLVFSIYGGALALFPPIIYSLYSDKKHLVRLSTFATSGVVLGFLFGWGIAFYGKFAGNGNLIFLSPTVSIGISSLILFLGNFLVKKQEHET